MNLSVTQFKILGVFWLSRVADRFAKMLVLKFITEKNHHKEVAVIKKKEAE